MYLEIVLADFVVFRVFLGISRDFAEVSEFRGSATARNIRSPVYTIREHILLYSFDLLVIIITTISTHVTNVVQCRLSSVPGLWILIKKYNTAACKHRIWCFRNNNIRTPLCFKGHLTLKIRILGIKTNNSRTYMNYDQKIHVNINSFLYCESKKNN